jgi:signal peptidase
MTAIALSGPVQSNGLRKFRKLLSNMAWAVLAILVLAACALGVYVHTGHGAITPVLTGSMRPGIQPGDAVVTKRVSVASLHVGDIVVFVPPGQKLARVHRIKTLEHVGNDIEVTTKGDANNVADPWGKIRMKGDTYKVAFVLPKIGKIVNGGLRWPILAFVFIGAVLIARWTYKYVRS